MDIQNLQSKFLYFRKEIKLSITLSVKEKNLKEIVSPVSKQTFSTTLETFFIFPLEETMFNKNHRILIKINTNSHTLTNIE